jgi:surface protein
MDSVFRGANSFNQNIGGWDVSSVTSMSSMLRSTSFNNGGSGDINDWDTSAVTAMNNMLLNASSFNQPIGGWDVSNVVNMASMFNGASSFNQDIGDWDMSGLVSGGTFEGANSMFLNATAFNQDLSGIVTGLTVQPATFSASANATFANNANGLKPFLADGVTQINT